MERYEIKLSGSGGQGLILAGLILAEAAALYDGKNAVHTQSYGPESRGGSSSSIVIISDEEIDYPKATKVNLLLSLTQESVNKYSSDIKDGGILIVDAESVKDIPAGNFKIYKLPVIATARKEVGKVIVANIVALGLIAALIGTVSIDAIKKALFARIPKGTEELNLKALQAGINLAKEVQLSQDPNL